MQSDQGETKKKFADEIAVAHSIEAVLAGAREAELACNKLAIKNDCGSCERARAERENVSPCQTIAKTTRVALERFELREQKMSKKNRLSPLQMGVTGHNKIDIFFSKIEQSDLQ